MPSAMTLKGLLCLAALGLVPRRQAVQAQSYPARPITVVVPFPAGGPSDVVARIVTEQMGKILGQKLVIENVGGAGGTHRQRPGGGGCAGRLHAARRQHGLACLRAGAHTRTSNTIP